MQQIIYIVTISVLVVIAYLLKSNRSNKKQLTHRLTEFPKSAYGFTVFRVEKDTYQPFIILEGNKVDELGYKIYKSHVADLDKIDILIRENQTGEVIKIVKNSDSESMIGVTNLQGEHFGYLQYEVITA